MLADPMRLLVFIIRARLSALTNTEKELKPLRYSLKPRALNKTTFSPACGQVLKDYEHHDEVALAPIHLHGYDRTTETFSVEELTAQTGAAVSQAVHERASKISRGNWLGVAGSNRLS